MSCSMHVNKQRGYRQLSVRAHVGGDEDARVNLFSVNEGTIINTLLKIPSFIFFLLLLSDKADEEEGDEPLYTEHDDDMPLDLK